MATMLKRMLKQEIFLRLPMKLNHQTAYLNLKKGEEKLAVVYVLIFIFAIALATYMGVTFYFELKQPKHKQREEEAPHGEHHA